MLVQPGFCRTCSEPKLLVFPRGGSFTFRCIRIVVPLAVNTIGVAVNTSLVAVNTSLIAVNTSLIAVNTATVVVDTTTVVVDTGRVAVKASLMAQLIGPAATWVVPIKLCDCVTTIVVLNGVLLSIL